MHFLHRCEKEISLFTSKHFFEQTFLQALRLNNRHVRINYDTINGAYNTKILNKCREAIWYREKIMYELQRLGAIYHVDLDLSFLDDEAINSLRFTFYSPDCFPNTDDYSYEKCVRLYKYFKDLPRPEFWNVFSIFYRIEANDLITILDNALYYADIMPILHINYDCFVNNYRLLKNFNFFVEPKVLSEALLLYGEDLFFDSPFKRFSFFKFCDFCCNNIHYNKINK